MFGTLLHNYQFMYLCLNSCTKFKVNINFNKHLLIFIFNIDPRFKIINN